MPEGFLLQASYRKKVGPEIHLWFQLRDGSMAWVIDDRFRPYFFVGEGDRSRAEEQGAHVEATELKTFADGAVVKAVFPDQGRASAARDALSDAGVSTFEADVAPVDRYLIDHGLRGSAGIEGPCQGKGPWWTYRNPQLTPCAVTPKLRVLSFDIETRVEVPEVLSVSLVCGESEEVILQGYQDLEGAYCVPDERALLERFQQRVRELDPDILTGWNVIDFDLSYLRDRAEALNLPFKLGRDGGGRPVIWKRTEFTHVARSDVAGRQVLDGLALVRDSALRLDRYTLENAARTLLGRGKLIASDERGPEIEEAYESNPRKLIAYNLEDSRLVRDILEQTRLVELSVERSLLTGMPLDRVGASVASLDRLYLPELRARGYVASNRGAPSSREWLTGGLVFDSTPGLFEWISVFDFKSLYPSIMRTFNIDPWAHHVVQDEDDAIRAPNGASFDRRAGILPAILDRLWESRDRAKQNDDLLASNAIKILMNSFYGVLGTTGCRFFDPEIANAITTFGQKLIRFAKESIEKQGYRVIYGDTDSVFVECRAEDRSSALELSASIRDRVMEDLQREVGETYALDSLLELEFEKVYSRFFLPELRHTTQGSKKRYAGLISQSDRERVEIIGLEAVRRDTPHVVREFQRGMLNRLFKDPDELPPYIREFIKTLREGKMDEGLIFHKAIRKDLDAYTSITPPHIKAARKMKRPPTRSVSYIITMNGPEPLEDDHLPRNPDYDYYVKNTLKPVGEAILKALDKNFDAILLGRRQTGLFDED